MFPRLESSDALFLDFDGTLVDFADSPGNVQVSAHLLGLLERLHEELDGALAMITGRPIRDLDRLLEPLQFAAAGEHGAEIRYWQGGHIVAERTMPPDLSQAIEELTERLQGTEAEIKQASVSLHFRQAPEHESAVVAGMRHLESQLDGYALMLGKMVAELKPHNVDKGLAIRDLCSRDLFKGRRPVFIGDDTTDESGFVAVNEAGGVSIRVGEAPATEARYRLKKVSDVHDWLARLV